MRTPSRKMAASLAITIVAAGAMMPAAFAASSSEPSTSTKVSGGAKATAVAAIKAKAAAAISIRVGALQTAISDVTANKYLTDSDRSTVLGTLNSDLSGLNALAPIVQADTTVTKARSDYDSIFLDFRVFALALPQTRLAAAADDLTGTVVPHLTDAQSRLRALLSGKDTSKDNASVQAAMTDLGHQINAIDSATNGLSPSVLAYTPAEWNANRALLAQPRSDLVTARADARKARSDIRTVVAALK